MINRSFGGKKQYFDDMEFSDELSPDPFSEESYSASHIHIDSPYKSKRSNKSQTSSKSKKVQNIEKTQEN